MFFFEDDEDIARAQFYLIWFNIHRKKDEGAIFSVEGNFLKFTRYLYEYEMERDYLHKDKKDLKIGLVCDLEDLSYIVDKETIFLPSIDVDWTKYIEFFERVYPNKVFLIEKPLDDHESFSEGLLTSV